MEILQQNLPTNEGKFSTTDFAETIGPVRKKILVFLLQVKSIGSNVTMDDYEKRKLGIFNQLNFFQLITGILAPVIGLFGHDGLPATAWIVAALPALISALVLYLNKKENHEAALLCYFMLYPFITGIVYFNGINLGVNLFFILYGILSVFFLQDIGYMLFSLSLSMISYFVLVVVLKRYPYQLETISLAYFLFNQLLAIVFIFCGLYLIKKENAGYQYSILTKNHDLHEKNLQIQMQKKELTATASLLQKKTEELTELNALKNRLFTVISHDLRAPIYALRNLFKNVQQYDIPAEELKTMVPDVMNDLNYTVALMENLLQWAKSQMEVQNLKTQAIDLSDMIKEVLQLLHLQAQTKQIYIDSKALAPVYAWADKDMINLVLRNLISNAIKFTPEQGIISVDVHEAPSFIEVYVRDNGMGISEEDLKKINQNIYYSTKGTASESGTGLGLMLCKEFLTRNGGQMHIESKQGRGSTFSFTLPKPE